MCALSPQAGGKSTSFVHTAGASMFTEIHPYTDMPDIEEAIAGCHFAQETKTETMCKREAIS